MQILKSFVVYKAITLINLWATHDQSNRDLLSVV